MRAPTRTGLALLIALFRVGAAAGQSAPSAASGVQRPAARGASATVTGRVLGEGDQPLAAAAVIVRRQSDDVAAGDAITGADGRFRVLSVPPGRYAVTVSIVGYRTGRVRVVVPPGGAGDAGTIRLVPAPIAVAGVEADARRSPVVMTPDRTAYSVKDLPGAHGGMATDVLRAIPELEVDVNGKLSLRGSSNLVVQIDGRPSPLHGDDLAQFLQQFPADRIERIEVIPNPSAKYDSEGAAGIVNIVLKHGADLGLSGSATLDAGNRSNGGSGRLAYQHGRLTTFANASAHLGHNQNSSGDFRRNLLATPVTALTQDALSNAHYGVASLDLSNELKLSQHSVLSLDASGWGFHGTSAGLTDFLLTDSGAVVVDHYDQAGSNHFSGGNTDVTLAYHRTVQPQRDELSLEARDVEYLNGWDARTTLDSLAGASAGATPGALSLNHTHHIISELSLQADWTHPLGKATRLEAGARLSARPVDHDNQLSLFAQPTATAQVQDGSWRHRATADAAYATLTRALGPASIQLGLRGERATSSFRTPATGERFDFGYRNLFPSAAFSYDLKKGRQLRLAYSKRIDRPYPAMMNPYVPSSDPLNRQVGNPYIAPVYTHSFTVDLSWTPSWGSVRLSPYYRRTNGDWEQIKEVDTAGVAWLTWKNLARDQAYGTSITGSVRQLGPVSGFVSLGAYRDVRDASNLPTGFSGASLRFSASTNGSVKLRNGLDGQFQLNYQPPRDIPQGRIAAMVMSSLGLKQKLNQTGATLTAAVTDPLGVWHYDFVTHDPTHYQSSHNTYSARRVTLSLNYVFGKPPQHRTQRPTADDPQGGGDPGGIH